MNTIMMELNLNELEMANGGFNLIRILTGVGAGAAIGATIGAIGGGPVGGLAGGAIGGVIGGVYTVLTDD